MMRHALFLLLSFFPGLAWATTITVGPTRTTKTIQEAVANAESGDVIEVDAWLYDGDITVSKDILIIGVSGSATTFIVGDVFIEGADVRISGFTSTPANRGFEITKSSEVELDDVIVEDVTKDGDGLGLYIAGQSLVTATDCIFRNLDGGAGTGAAVYVEGGDLILGRVSFIGNSAVDGGAIYADNSGLTFVDVTFSDNHASSVNFGRGGAIYATNDSVLDLEDVTFGDNVAEQKGGSIFMNGGRLALRGGKHEANLAASRGGSVWCKEVEFHSTDVVYTDNVAETGEGGHLFANGGTLEFYNSQLEGGAAYSAGGAVAIKGAVAQFLNGAFKENTVTASTGDGGALAVSSSTISITSTEFTENVAPADGGAIYIEDSGASVLQCSIASNEAQNGGAIYHDGDQGLLIDQTNFEYNSANMGGAVYWEPPSYFATLTVRDSQFASNEADEEGGGLYAGRGAFADLVRNDFVFNMATRGGGVYGEDIVALRGIDNTFCLNRVGKSGGAAYITDVVASGWYNNRLIENVASDKGAGFYHLAVELASIHNNSFLGNNGTIGGGGYIEDTTFTFHNNIVAHTDQGYGLSVFNSVATINNNDWYENSQTDISGDLTNSDLGDQAQYVDPSLMNYSKDGDCFNDEVVITYDSPLVDAGLAEIFDLDGSVSDIGSMGGPNADKYAWIDEDKDGQPTMWDCGDTNQSVYAGNIEIPYDGLDNDCLDGDLCDQDEDGFDHEDCGGLDCNDDDYQIRPGVDDIPEDGIDQDCNGADRR
ncbi:MAG: hypothetical protein HN348_17580, partial [Proteobacteria bacterium]|nr:hypothetical protein [Pseudomonadota bacterium]